MIKKIVMVLIIILSEVNAYGQNYYVAPAPAGNDGNTGLSGSPWATLQYAVNQLNAGDILTVEDGTYTGFYMDHVNGTASQRITITARNRFGVVINAPPAGRTRNCEFLSCSYVTFDGFEVTLAPGAGISVRTYEIEYTGINCRDNIIQYCHSHHNSVGDPTGSHDGIFTGFALNFTAQYNIVHDNGEHGIYVSNSTDNPVVRGNVIYHNFNNGLHMNSDYSSGGDGVIDGWLVENNVIYANGRTGINCDGDSTGICRNNLVFNNRAGMTLYQIDGYHGANDNLVVNNTFYTMLAADTPNTGSLRASVQVADGSNNNTLFNNIIYSVGTGGTASLEVGAVTGLQHDYNIVARMSGNGGNYSGTAASAHESAPDPSLVFNNPGVDFTLLPSSPAADAGINIFNALYAPVVDISGTARPQNTEFDIGCYERVFGTPTYTPSTAPSFTETATFTATNTFTPSRTNTPYFSHTETPYYSATTTPSVTETRTVTTTRTVTPVISPTATATQAVSSEPGLSGVVLYPNPADNANDITIRYVTSGNVENVTAVIYTLGFRKVIEAEAVTPSAGQIIIGSGSLAGFGSGLYIYRVTASGGGRRVSSPARPFVMMNKD